jgi:hypothetical protein
MIETYELYLLRDDRSRAFQAVTCKPTELVSRAMDVLEASDASGCDVEQFGHVLLRLAKSQ